MQRWIPMIARVECREEARAEERPIAVWFGGRRVPVRTVLEDARVGGIEAGEPIRHMVTLELDSGLRARVIRVLPAGEWRVYREASIE